MKVGDMTDKHEVKRTDGPVVPTMRLATSKLIEELKVGAVGAVRTDEDLSKICERNTRVGGNGYGYLQSAIRHVLRYYDLVWKRIPAANALRCLGPVETIDLARSSTRSIARKARRAANQLKAVKNLVTEDNRTEYLLSVAHTGTLALLASESGRKKLEVRGVDKPLDLGRLLENMRAVTK